MNRKTKIATEALRRQMRKDLLRLRAQACRADISQSISALSQTWKSTTSSSSGEALGNGLSGAAFGWLLQRFSHLHWVRGASFVLRWAPIGLAFLRHMRRK